MRKYFGVFLLVFLLLGSISVNAETNINNEDSSSEEVSELFKDFMDDFFNDVETSFVKNSEGKDVKKEFMDEAKEYYQEKDYESIQNIIKRDDLSISHQDRTQLKESETNDNVAGTLNTTIGENVSEYFYHLEEDTTGKYTKEWATKLSGSLTYDTSLNEVIHASSPILELTSASFGAAFSPGITNVYTDKSISTLSVNFEGNYKMEADLNFPIGNITLPFTYDFGTHKDEFTGYPSGLQ